MAPSIVIAAGGTGGHIYPGLALGRALGRVAPGARVSFVGTPRGLEGKLIPGAGYELDLVDMVPFAGWRRAVLPAALVRAAVQARSILRRRAADVAVGMGGYASIPLILGARLAGVPALVHESGAVPGKANLVAARLTRNVATAFDEVVSAFPASATVRTVGMPLGPELSGFDRDALRDEARQAFGLDDGTRFVLVSGGSQGAASLNRLAVGLAQRWRHRGDVRILLKAGARNLEEAQAAVAATGADKLVEVTRFIERMDHAYAAADVAVCRPGAGTVAELAVVGLPAVLVPYPHAPSDHQTRNAAALVEAGAAFLVRDHEATAEVVGPLLERVLDDRSELERMGSALRSIAHPRAADELAAWALELAGTAS
ncbi:MAG: UDP-N-acetylglucosamine--N-acetylmuramyl-(pentapeptide) pyrophosphoryl-undecaprenol N-acetylglucosamine transferase [Actinobacteria bacterium]|nr:UDP-N-acetylglucosamine--N-acetylmuramyl-(pentapeptide) pyrophosphoryl-undecaprenol N-acetylglucosamine transferase [Actinomycetota bacterium]